MLCYARVAYALIQAHLSRARCTERAHGGRQAARSAAQISTRSCDGSVRRTRRCGLADDRAARRARRAAARHRGTAPARLREQQHAQRGARRPCDAAYRTCTTCCGAASNRRWQQSLHVIGCPGAAPGRSLASIEPSPRPLAPPNGPRCIVCRVCRKVLVAHTSCSAQILSVPISRASTSGAPAARLWPTGPKTNSQPRARPLAMPTE